MTNLKRFFHAVAIFVSLAFAGAASANKYSDWWWNPTQSGQGLNVGQQGETLFIAWFTYDNNGDSMWVTMSGDVVNNAVSGDVLLFTGPKLGTPYDASKVANTKIGTARLTFTSLYTARFEWALSGGSGNMDVQRFTFKPLAYAGTYYTQCVGGSDCPGGVASYAVSTKTALSYDGRTLTATDEITGGKRCVFTAPIAEGDFLGSQIRAVGTYDCGGIEVGRWDGNVSFDRTGDQVVMIRRDLMTQTSGRCITRQVVTGPTLLR